MIYLWKRYNNANIVLHTDLNCAKLEGYTTPPEVAITEQEWEKVHSTAYIDPKTDKIVLGYSPAQKLQMLADQKRAERDNLLKESDKYMLTDFPISEEYREKIKEYRDQLRNLPENKKWPNVNMPVFPTK